MNKTMQKGKWFAVLVVLLLLPALACDVPGEVSIPGVGPAPTATPMGDTISYLIPLYSYTLKPGESVPGTRLTYVEREGDLYHVTIDGLAATKRIGDSFIWDGVISPGVYAIFNLRITKEVQGELPVAGPVEVVIFNPQPVEIDELPTEGVELSFDGILVNYLIPAGREVPGTTLAFVGIRKQGEGSQQVQLAELSGLSGYNLFAVGDSLVWRGKLLDHVAVEYGFRVTGISEEGLRLTGDVNLRLLRP